MPTITSTVTLGSGPATIFSDTVVSVPLAYGVYAPTGAPTLTNQGVIQVAGSRYITNFGTYPASDFYYAAKLNAGGTVTNSGTIGGTIAGKGLFIASNAPGQSFSLNNSGFMAGVHLVALPSASSVGVINSGTIGIAAHSKGTPATALYETGLAGSISSSNTGLIQSFGTAANVEFNDAIVTNTGSILGGNIGLNLSQNGNRLVNSGSITSTTAVTMSLAVGLGPTGQITNQAGAVISSSGTAVQASFGAVVSNAGTITGGTASGTYGIYIASGTVTNSAGAVISGNNAIKATSSFGSGFTIIDAGTIATSNTVSGYAIQFAANTYNVLDLQTGAKIVGAVLGGNVIGAGLHDPTISTINFYGTGTLGGIGKFGNAGVTVANFGSLAFEPGAAWTIGVSSAVLNAETISGFVAGDTIDIAGGTGVGASAVVNGGTVQIFSGASGSGTNLFTFTNLTGLAGASLIASALRFTDDGTGSTDVSVACFAEGTRILTPRGEVAVEALRAGDLVVTRDALRPIAWLGHRRVDCAAHPRAHDIIPLRVMTGAFGPGAPIRDLYLSPDHAVYVNGALIPIRYLLNGVTVAQTQCDAVTYYHIELPTHDVLFAEGLACESYLDTGNRSAFANDGDVDTTTPDFALPV